MADRKTIQEAAKEQAVKCMVFVKAAEAHAKDTGRKPGEILEEVMLARIAQAGLDAERRIGATQATKEAQDMIDTFIEANRFERSTEALLKKLASLRDNLIVSKQEAARA